MYILAANSQQPSDAEQAGFTLIELSIVLVIIGLIVAGILVGNDMVEQAQYRKTIKKIDEYKGAYHAFVLKYNCVPGDCANASSFGLPETQWGLTDSSTNGNGDGLISSDRSATPTLPNGRTLQFESWDALSHLFGAKMIPDNVRIGVTISNIPIADSFLFFTSLRYASPPAWYRTPDKAGNYLYIGSYPTNGQDFFDSFTTITPKQAKAIDLKMDDGLPMQGVVKASGVAQSECGASGGGYRVGPCYNWPTLYSVKGINSCVDDRVPPSIYNTSNNVYSAVTGSGALCSIHIPVD